MIPKSLKVHCWGGLGSQLYALALIYDLHEIYPNQSFEFIQHTAGVTRRPLEIDFIDLAFVKFTQIEDYSENIPDGHSRILFSAIYKVVKKTIKFLLAKSQLVKSFDSDTKVYPWTRSIRGHYSNRIVSTKFLDFMLSSYFKKNLNGLNNLAVHYRLGDLIDLGTKAPILAETIVKKILEVTTAEKLFKVFLYSDSPEIARDLIGNSLLSLNLTICEASTFTVINNCIYSDFFIGTPSKISIWIMNFRKQLYLSDKSFLFEN
jgi:hypothetical protein